MTLVKKKIPQIFRFPLSTPLSHLKTLWDLQSECFAKTQALNIQKRTLTLTKMSTATRIPRRSTRLADVDCNGPGGCQLQRANAKVVPISFGGPDGQLFPLATWEIV